MVRQQACEGLASEIAVTLQSPRTSTATQREVALAVCAADAVRATGRRLDALASSARRSVQGIEIAIDALELARICSGTSRT
ncbi:hypothetical protein [Micromonospora zamorensis]|uniref:hypothetical protein n=1 Tax=Micromonospora zamorensis TaxID=709883 RepID=UPI0033AAE206